MVLLIPFENYTITAAKMSSAPAGATLSLHSQRPAFVSTTPWELTCVVQFIDQETEAGRRLGTWVSASRARGSPAPQSWPGAPGFSVFLSSLSPVPTSPDVLSESRLLLPYSGCHVMWSC